MTRHDFFEHRSTLLRTIEQATAASVAVSFLALVVAIPVFVVDGGSLPPWVRITGLLIPLVIITMGPVVVRRRALARAQRIGLVCPKCGTDLLWAPLIHDQCSHCTSVVFADAAVAPLPSRLEFYDRVSALDDAEGRLWLLVVGAIAATVGAGLLFGLTYRLLGKAEPAWAGPVAGLAIVASIIGPWLFAGHRWELLVTRLGLRCPNCNEAVVGGRLEQITEQTMRTGRCPSCDGPVMSNVP